MTYKVPLKDPLLAQITGASGTDMIGAPSIGALSQDTLTNMLGAIYNRFETRVVGGITNTNLASGFVLEEVVTSSTRPPTYPVGGQIQETDTGKTFKNTGTADTPVWSEITANQTHDSLAGLTSGDPHTQYALTDGTRLRIYRGASAPAGPGAGQLWMDTSTAPPTFKEYDGGAWEIPQASGGGGGGGSATNIDNGNLATGRALEAIGSSTARPGSYPIGGLLYETDSTKLLKNTGTIPTPVWSDVVAGGDHNSLSNLTTGDPHTQYALASGARLVGLRQNTAPGSPATGQLWFDTSTTPATEKQWSGTAWILPQTTPADASVTTAKLAGSGSLTIPKVNLAALSVDNADLATSRVLIAAVTSATRPGTYPVGGEINETDTGKTFKNTGSSGTPVWSEITANQTHNSLAGLTTGDPHTQYALADGTRLRGYRGTVAPSSPSAGQIWMDTSTTPPTFKEYSGFAWEVPQGGAGYNTFQEEGAGVTQRTTVDFRGTPVTVTDDAAGTRTRVTVDNMKTVSLLNYTAATDISGGSGTGLAANSWTQLGSVAQSFTPQDPVNSFIEILVEGVIVATGTGPQLGFSLSIGGTRYFFGGGYLAGTSGAGTFLHGTASRVFLPNTFPAGASTITPQLYCTPSSAIYFCRPSTQPNTEFFRIQVIERRQV